MWAAVFPGQGSQHSGMGKFLFDNFNYVRESFELASDVLKQDMARLCFSGSEEELRKTSNTQPALLLVSSVYFDVLKNEFGAVPARAAGHSVGEYAAVVASQALSLQQALPLVRLRGEAMQKAVPEGEGGMVAAMGLGSTQVATLCERVRNESGEVLEPANFNAPGQIVLSGSARAVAWVQEKVKVSDFEGARRLKFIPLKVSAPFHCSLMKPAEEVMKNALDELSFLDAQFPIIQNYDAQPEVQGSRLREKLCKQVSSAVLWVDCVERLVTEGVNTCVELGPGKVLSGLIKKIDSKGLTTLNINSIEDLKLVERELNKGI